MAANSSTMPANSSTMDSQECNDARQENSTKLFLHSLNPELLLSVPKSEQKVIEIEGKS